MESEGPRTSLVRRREFPPTLKSIGSARDFVAEVLADPAWSPPVNQALVEDVQLVVSELVTNAITHGAGSTVLRLALTNSAVHCSVTSIRDGEPPRVPEPAVPSAAARSGRGLAIVNAVADSTATSVDQSTWAVTCEFFLE